MASNLIAIGLQPRSNLLVSMSNCVFAGPGTDRRCSPGTGLPNGNHSVWGHRTAQRSSPLDVQESVRPDGRPIKPYDRTKPVFGV